MQIKSIIAAAGALACLFLEGTAIAADAPTASVNAASEQQDMTKAGKPAATVSMRNTRPHTERHKDARACLDAGKNQAIIKCANKYRPH